MVVPVGHMPSVELEDQPCEISIVYFSMQLHKPMFYWPFI